MKELSELQEHIRTSMIDFHRKLSLPILPRQECKIKSIVIFTYLHEKHYNTGLPDEVYKELIHDGIGLIGPGDGCLTAILHKLFGWQPYIRSHGILHDAYGQFYNKYHHDKGYMYTINEKKTYPWMKKCMFLGQITGLYYCIKNKITI